MRGATVKKQEESIQARIAALRKGLREAGCDAFFSLSPPANHYLSGFRGTTSALVITLDEAYFLCDFRYTEQAREQVTGFEILEVAGAMETRTGERLRALGAARPGFDPAVLSVKQHGMLQDAFDGPLHALSGLPGILREIKDAGEIARIRAACALTEAALLKVLATVRPGVTEAAVAARLDYEFRKMGAECAAFPVIVLFGPRSSLPHGAPGKTPLESGDIMLVDCGCILDGYCADLTRTFVCGRIPGDWFQEIYQVVLQAQEAGIAALRAGTTGKEADAAARSIINDAGYGAHFGHGLGHGVGLEVHEAPRLNMQSETILQTGMAVTVEPGVYLPGQGGVRIEDLAVITDTGCEVLTRLPKELQVI